MSWSREKWPVFCSQWHLAWLENMYPQPVQSSPVKMLQLGPGQNLLTMKGGITVTETWQSQSGSWHRQAIDHCPGCENWELLHLTNDLWWEEREEGGGAGIIIVIVAIIVTFIRAENADKLQHIPTHPCHQSPFPLINTAESKDSNLAAIKWIDTQHRSNCTGGLSAKSGSNSGVLSVNPGYLTLHQITHYMGARYQIMGAVILCPGQDIELLGNGD